MSGNLKKIHKLSCFRNCAKRQVIFAQFLRNGRKYFMQHLRRMEGRVVLLTGGGGGIARGVARAFVDEGAKN